MSEYEGAPIGSVWRCEHERNFIVTAIVLEKPERKRMSSPPVYQTALYSYISAFTGEPYVELHEFFRIDLIEKGISGHKWRRID